MLKQRRTVLVGLFIILCCLRASMPAQRASLPIGSKAVSLLPGLDGSLSLIPSGATWVMIEGWGAGGAGGSTTGGQGGGYFKGVLPSSFLAKGACSFRSDNGSAAAICQNSATTPTATLTMTALAGAAGGSGLAGGYSASTTGSVGAYYFSGQQGQAGGSAKVIAFGPSVNANTLVSSLVGGDGGDSGGALETKGSGGWMSFVTTTNGGVIKYNFSSTATNFSFPATPGAAPGGGGGASGGAMSGQGTGAPGGAARILVTYCPAGGC